jgi:hypothetical protein
VLVPGDVLVGVEVLADRLLVEPADQVGEGIGGGDLVGELDQDRLRDVPTPGRWSSTAPVVGSTTGV